jgi:TetR/AcrR family transcriptional regulator
VQEVNHHADSATRQHLLQAALRSFARRGYAGTSVRQIVQEAGVTKPSLYYYFPDKARLFQAIVDRAHDERYELMVQAAQRGRTVGEKLEEIVAAVFEFSLRNRELMRLAFATAFAVSGEAPGHAKCLEKGRRNFEFICSLIREGQATGELSRKFDVEDLAMGIFGQLNSYVMVRLLVSDCPLDRAAARRIVRLFLEGAADEIRGPKVETRKKVEIRNPNVLAAGRRNRNPLKIRRVKVQNSQGRPIENSGKLRRAKSQM